jgi:hypothetical protein
MSFLRSIYTAHNQKYYFMKYKTPSERIKYKLKIAVRSAISFVYVHLLCDDLLWVSVFGCEAINLISETCDIEVTRMFRRHEKKIEFARQFPLEILIPDSTKFHLVISGMLYDGGQHDLSIMSSFYCLRTKNIKCSIFTVLRRSPHHYAMIGGNLTFTIRVATHQLRQDKHQDMRQKTQSCFIRDSSAWSWRQYHDQCAAVFIISFVSTVLISLHHVADIVSWQLHVLTHAGVRPTCYDSVALCKDL